MTRALIVVAFVALLGCSAAPSSRTSHAKTIQASEFRALLERLAAGWNAGDSRAAVACFTTDAIYTEPPRKQLYLGHAALYEFFGGDKGRPGEMQMRWN